ncbi:MAG: DUF4430 domain-containing protein [Eubacterium sp.]|nr:DUF4430 domain-containing protein [Eubacterium sp.]
MKRILSIVCAIALALSLFAMPVNTQAATAKAKTAYFTVEKISIGQGLLVQPTKVELGDKDTVADVFVKVAKANNIEFEAGDLSDISKFYLTNIKKADNGKLNIPEAISKMPQYDYDWGGGFSGTYYAPSNEKNDGNSALPDLGSYAYNGMAGWMFGSNNKALSDGAGSVLVNDGDVIRCKFSVFGYGADVGIGYEGDGATYPNTKLASKDALIKKLADVKDNKEFMSVTAAKKAYEDGLKVLEKYGATEAEIKTAISNIEKYENPAQKTKVGRAVIKSIKNVKGKKAKITVKKLKGATGYVFKYSKKKSLKGATKKDTKKLTIKTKKFKKKQTCYARVKAYAVVNGAKVFGKWSKLKKVKIKK